MICPETEEQMKKQIETQPVRARKLFGLFRCSLQFMLQMYTYTR